MRVAIDIGPLKSGHAVRGVGSYTKNLVEALQNEVKEIDLILFERPNSSPPVDIIHYPYFDLLFHTLPIKSNIKRVVTIHDVIPLVFPNDFPPGFKGYMNLFFQKKALKNTQAVICDSKTSKADIVDKLNYPDEKIFVVYLAPSNRFRLIRKEKILQEVSKKYNLPKNFVLYVGDVNWNKNIGNLLEAVKIAKVNLVMVGSALVDHNLPQTEKVDRAIKKLGLTQSIIRTGYVAEDDLVAIYNLANLTVLPSHYEGFGLPVLESMACGTPVVCSNVASLAEIGSKYALYCNPSNPNDIAQKINNVLSVKKEKISQSLINHTLKFTWQKVAGETINVYKYALENS